MGTDADSLGKIQLPVSLNDSSSRTVSRSASAASDTCARRLASRGCAASVAACGSRPGVMCWATRTWIGCRSRTRSSAKRCGSTARCRSCRSAPCGVPLRGQSDPRQRADPAVPARGSPHDAVRPLCATPRVAYRAAARHAGVAYRVASTLSRTVARSLFRAALAPPGSKPPKTRSAMSTFQEPSQAGISGGAGPLCHIWRNG